MGCHAVCCVKRYGLNCGIKRNPIVGHINPFIQMNTALKIYTLTFNAASGVWYYGFPVITEWVTSVVVDTSVLIAKLVSLCKRTGDHPKTVSYTAFPSANPRTCVINLPWYSSVIHLPVAKVPIRSSVAVLMTHSEDVDDDTYWEQSPVQVGFIDFDKTDTEWKLVFPSNPCASLTPKSGLFKNRPPTAVNVSVYLNDDNGTVGEHVFTGRDGGITGFDWWKEALSASVSDALMKKK